MTAEFTPQQVANLVSIADRTLRHWSTRFSSYLSDDAHSAATEHGKSHRKYTAQDVELLRRIRSMSEQRMRLSEIEDVLTGRKTLAEATAPIRQGGHCDRIHGEQQAPEAEILRAMSSVMEENQRLLATLQDQLTLATSILSERLEVLNKRLGTLEKQTEERLVSLEKRTEERLASLDRRLIERIYAIEQEMSERGESDDRLPGSPSQDNKAQTTRGGWLGLLKKRMPTRGRPSPLSRNLIRLMAARRWGRNDLALYSHVRVETITRILSGELTEPKPQTLEALAQALGTSAEALANGRFEEAFAGKAR